MLIASTTFEVPPLSVPAEKEVKSSNCSPLHTSVQKVQQDLFEFSQLFNVCQNKSSPGIDVAVPSSSACVRADATACEISSEESHVANVSSPSQIADDCTEEIPTNSLNAANFVKEVLLAAGLGVSMCSTGSVPSTTDLNSKSKDFHHGASKAAPIHVSKRLERLTKRREKWYMKDPSLELKRKACNKDNNKSKEDDILKFNASQKNVVAALEENGNVKVNLTQSPGLPSDKSQVLGSDDNQPEQAETSSVSRTTSPGICENSAPCPSGVLLCSSANPEETSASIFKQPMLTSSCALQSQDSVCKRFSITSDDLEDIFAGFADRKSILTSENSDHEDVSFENGDQKQRSVQIPCVNSSNSSCCQYVDICKNAHLLEKPPTTNAMDRSCQTSVSGIHSDMFFCSVPNADNKAVEPPGLKNFLSRAEHLSNLVGQEQDVKIFRDPITPKEKLPLDLRRSKLPELTLARSSLLRVATGITKNKAIQIGGEIREQASRISGCSPGITCHTKPILTVAEENNQADVTPSKWSFKHKLQLFEKKSANHEGAVSTANVQLTKSYSSSPELKEEKRECLQKLQNFTKCDGRPLCVTTSSMLRDSKEIGTSMDDNSGSPLFITAADSELSHCANGSAACSYSAGQQVSTSTPINVGRQIDIDVGHGTHNRNVMLHLPRLLKLDFGGSLTHDNLPYSCLHSARATVNVSLLSKDRIPRSHLLPGIAKTVNISDLQCASPREDSLYPSGNVQCLEVPHTTTGNTRHHCSKNTEEALDVGIDLLSTELTNSVLQEQLAALRISSIAEASVNFSGISYDPSYSKNMSALCINNALGKSAVCEQGNTALDTSVWAESQISSASGSLVDTDLTASDS